MLEKLTFGQLLEIKPKQKDHQALKILVQTEIIHVFEVHQNRNIIWEDILPELKLLEDSDVNIWLDGWDGFTHKYRDNVDEAGLQKKDKNNRDGLQRPEGKVERHLLLLYWLCLPHHYSDDQLDSDELKRKAASERIFEAFWKRSIEDEYTSLHSKISPPLNSSSVGVPPDRHSALQAQSDNARTEADRLSGKDAALSPVEDHDICKPPTNFFSEISDPDNYFEEVCVLERPSVAQCTPTNHFQLRVGLIFKRERGAQNGLQLEVGIREANIVLQHNDLLVTDEARRLSGLPSHVQFQNKHEGTLSWVTDGPTNKRDILVGESLSLEPLCKFAFLGQRKPILELVISVTRLNVDAEVKLLDNALSNPSEHEVTKQKQLLLDKALALMVTKRVGERTRLPELNSVPEYVISTWRTEW